ncbi:40S ribosomal protein S26-B [Komagataella phaffii CBS 7435]|uniref:40S ribosomal protein S26-B n=1 Tax=Komagataella phaffii (strain ATCC 76273 / CBS 7435 / CECT 11047 / NRRL Y-11430 / Wegner 21-1) TaxID=981350 RepID=A0A1G4KPZ4_KOMPC|nr:40S ribosomal protein S26-B [Komagataella phaffii CBS 7435]SCV12084.1 40S ribosomal protein S26-B [Komagataella phaffii CBS 7435]
MIHIRITLHLQSLLGSFSWVDSSVIAESLSLRRSSDSSVTSGSDSDNSSVDSTGNTVVQLVVKLWKSILLVNRGLRQISDGSSLNHVSDGDTLNGLVLRNTSGTVQTSDKLNVSSTLLVSTVGSSLFRHVGCWLMEKDIFQTDGILGEESREGVPKNARVP